ncbi:hypothetical protein V1517DRAFT_130033 [Lipomyces orientalis]|uniref:Uncharacterized protein n=1 Tax=Lipomyces orientalis TaxID=1233043 RepID=A0ACC3TR72_9ASCO
MDDYAAAMPASNAFFDFADCEDFLARLEAEETSGSSYASSHSLSPGELLSSGHGSSPLSSFSPQTDDPNDPNSWGADAFLFPLDSNNNIMPLQSPQQVLPPVKAEYNQLADPAPFLFETDTSSYAPAEYSTTTVSNAASQSSSITPMSPTSISPASSASSQMLTPPYKTFVPSPPGMYTTEPQMLPSPPLFQHAQQQPQQLVSSQQKAANVNLMASAAGEAKGTVTASKRSLQTITAQAPVRKSSTSGRGIQHQSSDDLSPPELGAKGGKITKPKKTAHNMIEKRYRTNLNDKIAALRDCVPALRCAVTGSFDDDVEELDGLAPANKLNKATVLTKATEYILHLQQRNAQLQRENKALLEGQIPESMMGVNGSPPGADVGMMGGAQGMMSVSNQQTVGDGTVMGRGAGRMGGVGRNMMGKIMMGSMAGMVVANSFNDVDGQNTRGLAAVPFMIRASVRSALGPHAQAAMSLIRGLLLLGTVMYIFYPSLFMNSSGNKNGKAQTASVSFAAQPLSVSMPLEVRQQAWLTATRTVIVPPRATPLEIYAVAKKLAKLALRRVVGFDGYKLLVGTTEEEDFARTAAWKTAIDAQLGGGDANCSHVRLLITLLSSFLIPATPIRAMMQALHVKILLHDFRWVQGLSNKYQRSLWEEARQLQRQQQEQGDSVDASEKTPEHIVHLLECDDVFDADTVTRAYNLTWNNPPGKGCASATYRDDGFNSTMEDSAIKSPLDALAAWYSCRKLRGALVESLDGVPDAAALAASAKVAPPNSIVHRRALIARSVLLGDICPEYMREMMEAVREDLTVAGAKKEVASSGGGVRTPVRQPQVQPETADTSAVVSEDEKVDETETEDEADEMSLSSLDDGSSTLIDEVMVTRSPGPATSFTTMNVLRMLSSPDTRAAIRCALVQTLLPSRPYVAEKVYSALKVYEASELGLLGFVAVLTTVRKMQRRRPVEKATEALVGRARIWIGGDEGEAAGIATETRREIVKECVNIGMRLGGYVDTTADEEDEGYAAGE